MHAMLKMVADERQPLQIYTLFGWESMGGCFAQYYASLILIAAFITKPVATMNYARRANYVRSTNDGRRPYIARSANLVCAIREIRV
jgi:hypothetical protein